MKQKLGRAAFGAEHNIARYDVIANQKTIEVLAHSRREGVEFLRLFRGTPGVTEDYGVAAKLLVEKRDRPTARHPIALRRIDRLKGIVPIAIPIADQACAGDETFSHRRDQSVDMGRDGIGLSRLLEVVLAPP